MRCNWQFVIKYFIASGFVLIINSKQLLGQRSTLSIDTTLTPKLRSNIIDSTIKTMLNFYVFPEVAKEVEKQLRLKQKNKEYENIKIPKQFAKAITNDLRAITNDKHLSVNFSLTEVATKKPNAQPTTDEKRGIKNYGEAINFGFEKIERLNGNIGYMRLNLFFPIEYSAETAAAALKLIENTEALIIDLRGNDGGEPEMLVFFASYFFGASPVKLSSLYQRRDNKTYEKYTYPYVPGKRYLNKRVYIVTGKRTFSAGEGFAYDLKHLKRATIVGDTTEGAAHPRDVIRIQKHYWMGVPVAKPIHPVTKSNWEGVGVIPDIYVPEEMAFKKAHLLALKQLSEVTTDEFKKDNLKKFIQSLENELSK